MLEIIAKCDRPKCNKKKGFISSSVLPEYPAIINMLKKMGWIVTDCKHFCSWKCQEDYEIQCEHDPIEKDGYVQCAKCGKVWQPDYDLEREGK